MPQVYVLTTMGFLGMRAIAIELGDAYGTDDNDLGVAAFVQMGTLIRVRYSWARAGIDACAVFTSAWYLYGRNVYKRAVPFWAHDIYILVGFLSTHGVRTRAIEY